MSKDEKKFLFISIGIIILLLAFSASQLGCEETYWLLRDTMYDQY